MLHTYYTGPSKFDDYSRRSMSSTPQPVLLTWLRRFQLRLVGIARSRVYMASIGGSARCVVDQCVVQSLQRRGVMARLQVLRYDSIGRKFPRERNNARRHVAWSCSITEQQHAMPKAPPGKHSFDSVTDKQARVNTNDGGCTRVYYVTGP